MEIFSSNEPEINHNEVPIHNEEEYELFIGNKQLKSSQKDANKESGFESNITDHSGKRPPDGGIQVKPLILIYVHLNIVLLSTFHIPIVQYFIFVLFPGMDSRDMQFLVQWNNIWTYKFIWCHLCCLEKHI